MSLAAPVLRPIGSSAVPGLAARPVIDSQPAITNPFINDHEARALRRAAQR